MLVVLVSMSIFSCQRDYICQCETINELHNPDGGLTSVHTVRAKDKETATSDCESLNESWGTVETTCTMM